MAPNDPVRLEDPLEVTIGTVQTVTNPVTVGRIAETVASPDLDDAVYDSLAYRIAELERHFHNSEHWFGRNSGDFLFDNTQPMSAFTLTTGGAGSYGAELLLTDGVRVAAQFPGQVYYDLHRVFISTLSAASTPYMVQLWYGTGLFAAATLLTEFPFLAPAAFRSAPVSVMTRRILIAGNNVWARAASTAGAATIQLTFGAHFYNG